MDSESVAHVLWQCEVAQDIWAGSIRRLQKGITGQPGIWNQRNLVLHGGKIQNPSILIRRARDYLVGFKDKQSQLATSATTGLVQEWRPPMGLAFKLNFDAAIFVNTNSSGVGVIIRNSLGEVLAGLSARGPFVASREEAEVLAFRKALEFALDTGFLDLVIKGYNATLMTTIESPHLNMSRLGHIYDDISTLASSFRSLSVGCIKRNANSVAHFLAHYASQLDEDLVWMEESPPPALNTLHLYSISLNE